MNSLPSLLAGIAKAVDALPSKSRVPGKREASIEKSLAIVGEAHQKASEVAAALEGEIERLSHPLPPESVGGKGEVEE